MWVCYVCNSGWRDYYSARLHAYRSFSVIHWLRNVYVWDLITNNSIENQLVMIFLNHRCYCHPGIPRIVQNMKSFWAWQLFFFFFWQVSSRRRRKKTKTKQTILNRFSPQSTHPELNKPSVFGWILNADVWAGHYIEDVQLWFFLLCYQRSHFRLSACPATSYECSDTGIRRSSRS